MRLQLRLVWDLAGTLAPDDQVGTPGHAMQSCRITYWCSCGSTTILRFFNYQNNKKSTLIMSDSLSIIGEVAVVVHTVNKTGIFIASISNAPSLIQDLATTFQVIEKPLRTCSNLVQQIPYHDAKTQTDVADTMRPAMTALQQVTEEIDHILRPCVTCDIHDRWNWKQYARPKEGEIRELLARLKGYGDSLNVTAQYVSLYVTDPKIEQSNGRRNVLDGRGIVMALGTLGAQNGEGGADAASLAGTEDTLGDQDGVVIDARSEKKGESRTSEDESDVDNISVASTLREDF